MSALERAVRAVGFDFDHTLGVDNRIERVVALELLGSGGDRAADLALSLFRDGVRPLDDALRSVGIDPQRFRLTVVARAPEFIKPLPGVHGVLAEFVRARIPIAILSNGWSPLQEVKAQLVGFPGPVLVSERLGVRKPDTAAFLYLRDALGVPCAEILYVGDDPRVDVGGATAAGMQGVWFDWERRSYPQDVAPPSARIGELTQLRALVQGPESPAAKPPA